MRCVSPLIGSALIIALVAGCTTYKNYSPNITEPTRSGLVVNPPVLVSVFDGRGNREGSNKPDQDLIRGIRGAYPNAVQIVDYFSPTPSGRVRVRIRVQELGAQFGNRIVSGVAIQSQFTRASGSATDGWNTVVAQAAAQQNTFGSAIATEGWWVGTAWLEVQVEDKRRGRNIDFTLPLVSEHRESNTWGFASAQAASKRAWSTVSAKLFSTLDNVLIKARQ
jgi:hypothetical protein